MRLRLSGFDYEVSAEAELDVTVAEARLGARARAACSPTSPAACRASRSTLATDGSRVRSPAESARFTLPTLPLDEYPSLPDDATR